MIQSEPLPRNVEEDAAPERIPLRAGPLSMVFETETAFLRYIRLGDREVLRGIYAAVRDRHWNTVPPRVSVRALRKETDAFDLTFDVEARQREIDFLWRGTITGSPDGTLRCTMEGRARTTFLRNRIGFCVLHPAEACAGRACTAVHVDGTEEQGQFPRHIAPHQPFENLRAIAHEVAPGLRAEVRFEGDVFEMEDQRNWTDASFKTYCTPLRLPFPVEVPEGTVIRQAVTLSLHGARPPAERARAAAPEAVALFLREDTAPVPLPRIGLGLAPHAQPLGPREIARLRALGPSHLRVDLKLSDPGFRRRLAQAVETARALAAPLEMALFVTDEAEAELHRLCGALDVLHPRVARWLVFHEQEQATSGRWIRLARQILPEEAGAPIGGGTNVYFAELNRARPPAAELDVVCYSVNPQVHAFDDRSLVETLPVQAETVENARRLVPGAGVAVTPVTLRPRFNPEAAGEEAQGEKSFAGPADPRQPALFGAAWTLGSLKYLAEGGADSVTYYETTGPRGVMETNAGAVFPLYHVLADVRPFAGGAVHRMDSGDPLRTAGFLLRKDGRARVLLANLSDEHQVVQLAHPQPGAAVRIRALDETNRAAAMHTPEDYRNEAGRLVERPGDVLRLDLQPCACACVDLIHHE